MGVITKLSNERVPHQSTSPVTISESTCNTIPNVNTVNVEAASNVSDNNTPIKIVKVQNPLVMPRL